jgi:AcrR family transcriptional regulator
MARIVKNADDRRDEIIKAARELFQTKDYGKTTMQELIIKLNIAKGTLYHYFASKQEILEAVVENIVDEELANRERLLNSTEVKDLGAIEKIRMLITVDDLTEENELILQGLHHPENTEMHTKQLGRYITKLAPLYAEIFAQGCAEGVFKTDYPLEAAEFILAGVQFLTDQGFYQWSNQQIERRMQAFSFLIEKQLGAPAGSFSFLNEK